MLQNSLAVSLIDFNQFHDDPSTDPKTLPRPAGWRVLVKPLEAKEKIGSVYIGETSREHMQYLAVVGRVLAVGDTAYTREDMGGAPWCEVGDYVVFGKSTGWRFKYNGVELLMLNDDHVMAVLPKPAE